MGSGPKFYQNRGFGSKLAGNFLRSLPNRATGAIPTVAREVRHL